MTETVKKYIILHYILFITYKNYSIINHYNTLIFLLSNRIPLLISGLLFHVCGEAVVNVNSTRADRQTDKENYIDFRLRLLGEPGINIFISF